MNRRSFLKGVLVSSIVTGLGGVKSKEVEAFSKFTYSKETVEYVKRNIVWSSMLTLTNMPPFKYSITGMVHGRIVASIEPFMVTVLLREGEQKVERVIEQKKDLGIKMLAERIHLCL